MKPIVKITGSGKVSLRVSKSLKGDLLMMLEGLADVSSVKIPLTLERVNDLRDRAGIMELYTKHYMNLSFIGKESKITVSMSEALLLFKYMHLTGLQNNPEAGLMLMELHQKLS